jgi:hypothetical protein
LTFIINLVYIQKAVERNDMTHFGAGAPSGNGPEIRIIRMSENMSVPVHVRRMLVGLSFPTISAMTGILPTGSVAVHMSDIAGALVDGQYFGAAEDLVAAIENSNPRGYPYLIFGDLEFERIGD